MNKASLPPAALLAVMLAFCIGNSAVASKEVSRWQSQLHTAAAYATEEDWAAASAVLEESYTDWSARQTWLHIVSRHDAVDDAEAMYRRAIAFAAEEESSEFRAETADLISQLGLLAEMERFSLKNIL